MNIFSLFCYVGYAISWYAYIPTIYRVIKRKSSQDFSKQSTILSAISVHAWLIYVLFANFTIEMLICTIVDEILIAMDIIVIFKYHDKVGEGDEQIRNT